MIWSCQPTLCRNHRCEEVLQGLLALQPSGLVGRWAGCRDCMCIASGVNTSDTDGACLLLSAVAYT